MKNTLNESEQIRTTRIATPKVPGEGFVSQAFKQSLDDTKKNIEHVCKVFDDLRKNKGTKEFLDATTKENPTDDVIMKNVKLKLDESLFESIEIKEAVEVEENEIVSDEPVEQPFIIDKGYYIIKKFKYPDHYKMTIYVNTECDAEHHGFTSTGKRKLTSYPEGLWEEIEYRLDGATGNQTSRPSTGTIVGKPELKFPGYDTESMGVDYSLYNDNGTGYMGLVVNATTEEELAFAKALCAEYNIPEKVQ